MLAKGKAPTLFGGTATRGADDLGRRLMRVASESDDVYLKWSDTGGGTDRRRNMSEKRWCGSSYPVVIDRPTDGALRMAVARLMATGDGAEPWWAWGDVLGVSCLYCAAPWSDCAEDVTHDPDCPALAVEAAYREGGGG